MRDGALKWALRLLGLALTIGPIIIAFGINNWDIKATVLPSDAELNQVTNQVKGVFGGGLSPDTFTHGNLTSDGNNVQLQVTFKSPLNVPIKITSISINVSNQGAQLTQLHMQEGVVDVPANGTANLTFVGSYSGTIPVNPQLSATATFETYGVTVQLNGVAIQGGQL